MWSTVLVLGGIRSGKSAFAESLVGDAAVRYAATAAAYPDDAEWTARLAEHRARRPETWTTEEVAADPDRLVTLIAEAKPDEVLLIDDLAGWVTAQLDREAGALASAVGALASAVQSCAGRLVVVSPEVGLSVVPPTAAGRAFADQLGAANQALAAAADAVVLVVAGQATWLKNPRGYGGQPRRVPASTRPAPSTVSIQPGLDLPMPDETASGTARETVYGFGALTNVIAFAAGTQWSPSPVPWTEVRVVVVHGEHAGGAGSGPPAGSAALDLLAAEAGVPVQRVEAPPSRALETEDSLTADEVAQALADGWALAEAAVDSGVDLILLGATGSGGEAAAAAVTSALTGAEAVQLLGRVATPDGRIDDAAWMERCAAVRDGLHRVRSRPRGAHDMLAALGGGDVALATGLVLGAASRRTPVVVDGPIGAAAALVSRDLGGQARHWCLLADGSDHPTVRHAAEVLGLTAVADLKLRLGEGAGALAVLPLLRAGLLLASTPPAPSSTVDDQAGA